MKGDTLVTERIHLVHFLTDTYLTRKCHHLNVKIIKKYFCKYFYTCARQIYLQIYMIYLKNDRTIIFSMIQTKSDLNREISFIQALYLFIAE